MPPGEEVGLVMICNDTNIDCMHTVYLYKEHDIHMNVDVNMDIYIYIGINAYRHVLPVYTQHAIQVRHN